MSTFLDGPAAGVTLSLQRAPYFLRVVIDAAGNVDALDLLTDEPEPGETVYVYAMVPGSMSSAIVCTRGKGCRNLAAADYKLYERQPPDAVARDNGQWPAWCFAEYQTRPDRTTP